MNKITKVLAVLSAVTMMAMVPMVPGETGNTAFNQSIVSVSAASTGAYRVNTPSGVNVRTSAGTNGSKVGAAANGVRFTVSRISGNWGYTDSISTGNGTKSGWVCLDYCQYEGENGWSSVAEGRYVLVPACASNSCIDISGIGTSNGTNVQIWQKVNNQLNQQMDVRRNGNGTYTFYPVHTGTRKAIDCSGGNVYEGNNIQLWDSNGTDSQKFWLKDEGNGYFSLHSALNSNYVADVSGAGSGNGTTIHMWTYNRTSAQLFRFEKVGSSGTVNSSGALITNSVYNVSVSNKAKENQPHYENSEGSRSRSAYDTVINQFNVASNNRYKIYNGNTYCNIYAWDVMSAMRVKLPHWLKNNEPATSNTSGAYELNANATYNWLANYGSSYGWKKVSAYEAQTRANSGYPTIAIWKNTSGGPGHVMVVRPEGNGYSYSSSRGPVISQAGATNINYWNVSNAMGSRTPVYYTHN